MNCLRWSYFIEINFISFYFIILLDFVVYIIKVDQIEYLLFDEPLYTESLQ